MTILHLLHLLGHPDRTNEVNLNLINAELLDKHGLKDFVTLTADGVSIGGACLAMSVHVLHLLLVDAFNAGHEASALGKRLEGLIVATAAAELEPKPCDHNSPRKASSGIDAGVCGDCGKFVGKRRPPGPTGSGL